MNTHHQRINAAVKDPDWQAFRISMKGKSTLEKQAMLLQYWTFSDRSEVAALRLDNYIKALCRGGQLYPGESFETFMNASGALRIKRER